MIDDVSNTFVPIATEPPLLMLVSSPPPTKPSAPAFFTWVEIDGEFNDTFTVSVPHVDVAALLFAFAAATAQNS